MAYLSLYRKYRSQSFEEVSGQDHVTRTLQNAIRNGRVAHAYLLCGPRGTGKTTTARLLAKAMNCEQGPTPEPCNECDACVQITEGRFLDMREIDAASNRGIDEMRDLRDNVAFAPAEGRFKVYVIDEAHQLTNEAFNALLKTLEEPPPHVLFVLATTEAHKVPTTVASRCQQFDFRRASLEQLRERVGYVARAEGAEVEPAALDLIARDANGGWRDALSLLEQVLAFSDGKVTAKDVYAVLGTVEAETLHRLAAQVLAGQGGEVMRLLDELICQGKDPRQLIRDLTAHYRGLLLAAVGCPPEGEPDQAARTLDQARAYGHARLMAAIEVLAQTEREARWSEQPRLLLELAAVRLMHPRQASALVDASTSGMIARPSQPAPSSPPISPRPGPTAAQKAAPSAPSRPHEDEPPLPEPPPINSSPFVDEELAQSTPTGNGRKPAGFGAEILPPPPLTVGDARTGDSGDDEDLGAAFEMPPARTDAPASSPPAPAQRTVSPGSPAPPETAAPTAAPHPAASSGVDLGLLRSKWRLIGEELKRDRKATIQACLVDTLPDRMEGDVLVIRFPSKTMAEMFNGRGKAFSDPLSAAILRLTGAQVRARGEHSDGAVPAAAAAPTAPRTSGGATARTSSAVPDASRPAANVQQAALPAPSLLSEDAAAPSPTPPPRPGGTGSELVHDVLDVFDGQIIDERDLE